ncbi:hypothetical protein [Geomicrobium sp. JCM 19039]|uniref:hypothetical protein n=1 Tax=Geomicrobium sp. JCM 19039 TaxID=1460636 RepID=UPI00045F46B1|nr:hypothetical protein [Geomicrobium sp. JCM 19039]GAK12239.1 putative tail fibre protein [Geomicrobium sp. JCM 19039]
MPTKGVYQVEVVGGSTGGGGGGMRWHDGVGEPDGSLGQPGDMYLNTSNGDVYANENGTWNQVANIQGPAGSDGANGSDGEQGPPGQDGADGQDAENQFTLEQRDALLELIDDGGDD